MKYGAGIFILSIWLSGFLAHANMKFESLLSVVVGVVIASVLTSKGKKR